MKKNISKENLTELHEGKGPVSHAQIIWQKKVANKKLICTESRQEINIGDTYYERIADITLYDIKMDLRMGRFLTEKEYFKQKLKGNIDND